MKTRSIPVAAVIALILVSSAWGEFVPGHVFVAQSPGKLCNEPAVYGSDRIWEIDPQTGQATLFVRIPPELCGFITGLAFTPDGARLRASMWLRNEILEFDSEGNMTIALDVTDGIACPWGFNNLAYDAEGNFYVAHQCPENILRFPADGGAPSVFADTKDGVEDVDAIAFAADGDLYFTIDFPYRGIRRITPQGNASFFDSLDSLSDHISVTADDSGHVYVGLGSTEIFKYDAGNPGSKELLAVFPIGGRHSMAMSPDQSKVYGNSRSRLFGIDVLDGTVTTLAEFDDGFSGPPAGIAVVPPPPIPTLSGWFLPVMALLMLTAGTVVLIRRRVGTMGVRSRCVRGGSL